MLKWGAEVLRDSRGAALASFAKRLPWLTRALRARLVPRGRCGPVDSGPRECYVLPQS